MALSDIVNVSIAASTQAVTAPGFGVPLILGYHTKFAELVRHYTSLAAMTADGFSASTPEYMAAVAMQGQSPAPSSWAVGRRTHVPTQIVELTPTAKNSATYTVTINGVAYSYTADSSATLTEIIGGLVTAIGSPTGVTPSNYGPNQTLRLTGTAGTFFTWAVSDDSGDANGMGLWSVQDITADSNADLDLAACAAADSGWYAFCSTFQNAIDGAKLAISAESLKKLHLIDLADNIVKTSSSADLATTVKSAAEQYTAVCYHQKQGEFLSAAWLGKCLPMDPGSETWKFKSLATISGDILTDSEVGYIKAKNANWYQSLGGVNITQNGTTGKPQFIDVVRFLDWLKANIQADVYGILVNNAKVPYTDGGVALIEGSLRARLQNGEDVGGLAKGSSTVTVPLVANELAADRANRTIPDIYFTGVLAGAVHSLTINGVVSV